MSPLIYIYRHMTISKLPTANQLAKLPLRAVLSYAARCARRISHELIGVIDEEIVDRVLAIAEKVASDVDIAVEDEAKAALAGADVAEAIALASTTSKRRLAALAIIRTASVTYNVVHAATSEYRPSARRASAAKNAEQIARRAPDVLDEVAAVAAIEAAVKDYETLLDAFGEHEDIIPGDPVDPRFWR